MWQAVCKLHFFVESRRPERRWPLGCQSLTPSWAVVGERRAKVWFLLPFGKFPVLPRCFLAISYGPQVVCVIDLASGT